MKIRRSPCASFTGPVHWSVPDPRGNDGSDETRMPTVGRDQGKAQSERPKRDPRRVTASPKVAVNDLGQSRHQSAQSGGPAPASKTVQGVGTNLGALPGLVFLCPGNSPLLPAITIDNRYIGQQRMTFTPAPQLSAEDRTLIAAFEAQHGVTVCPPATFTPPKEKYDWREHARIKVAQMKRVEKMVAAKASAARNPTTLVMQTEAAVAELRAEGLSENAIAVRLGLPRSTLRNRLARATPTPEATQRPAQRG